VAPDPARCDAGIGQGTPVHRIRATPTAERTPAVVSYRTRTPKVLETEYHRALGLDNHCASTRHRGSRRAAAGGFAVAASQVPGSPEIAAPYRNQAGRRSGASRGVRIWWGRVRTDSRCCHARVARSHPGSGQGVREYSMLSPPSLGSGAVRKPAQSARPSAAIWARVSTLAG
jgi:hypothetical protein